MATNHDAATNSSALERESSHPGTTAAVARIIVPLDGSPLAEQALDYAFAFAQALGVELRLVRVVPPLSTAIVADPSAPYLPPEIYDDLIESGLAEARSYLHELTSSRFPGARHLSMTVVSGSPGEQIVAITHELPGTLVVMSSHGRTGVGRALLGSVAEHVVRNGKSPVVLIRSGMRISPLLSGSGGPIARIVVALDGTTASEAVLPTVVALARPLGAKIVLVHVQHPGEAESQRATAQLDRVRDGLAQDGLAVETKVISGQLPAAISVLAGLDERSLIAMATHARIGLDRLVSGSVAGEVFRAATCPVLLVRSAEGRGRAE